MSSGRFPTFFVIGAAKSGTSSLFRHLEGHPQVWVPPGKEIHYFDHPAATRPDLDWYRAQFAAAPPGLAVGDLTPNYLVRPWAAAEIAEVVPDARLVAILRNPVDRAHSHFQMQEAKFPVCARFEDIVAAELAGQRIEWPHSAYIDEGRYAVQLERYLEHFEPEQLLVLLFEDLQRDPAATMKTLCVHLGVDSNFAPPNLGQRFNQTRPVRSPRLRRVMLRLHLWRTAPSIARLLDRLNERSTYRPMSPELREELLELYTPDNARLADLLGRDLSAWSSGGVSTLRI